ARRPRPRGPSRRTVRGTARRCRRSTRPPRTAVGGRARGRPEAARSRGSTTLRRGGGRAGPGPPRPPRPRRRPGAPRAIRAGPRGPRSSTAIPAAAGGPAFLPSARGSWSWLLPIGARLEARGNEIVPLRDARVDVVPRLEGQGVAAAAVHAAEALQA